MGLLFAVMGPGPIRSPYRNEYRSLIDRVNPTTSIPIIACCKMLASSFIQYTTNTQAYRQTGSRMCNKYQYHLHTYTVVSERQTA